MKIKLKHMVVKLLMAIIVSGMGMASCTYHTNDYDPSEAPDGVEFERDIIPIFELKCNDAGCHNGTIDPDLRAENAYVNLIRGDYVEPENSEGSVLYQVIDGGTMTGFATDLERSYIQKWIDEGALDN